jgi:serine phosphatase RsbU (regulator of sigma subunit)
VTRLDLGNKEEFNFTQFTKEDGLSSNTAYVIDFDSDGNLWIGSNKGLDRINMSIYSITGKVFTKHYGKLDGFRGIECVQNASAVDHQGNLWFATNVGVTKYNLEEDRINKTEPITNLKEIRLFFESVDWTEYADQVDYSTGLPLGLELPYAQNHLTFDFVGVSLTIPDNVKYRFYLMGLDNVWSPPSTTPEAVYSNIPPGEYTFMVMSANSDGIWNKQPVKFDFTINPPFWKTWWFTLVCLLVTVGGLYTYLSRREKRIMKQQKILEEMVTERTHQLNEKKKEVELQNEEIAKKNKDITGSIYYAQRIQEAILPDRNNLVELIPESFIFFKPKDIVSGDFYWFKRESNKVFIAAVDCTGHGVPGAFMSMVANQLLSRIIIDDGVHDPGEVLRLLHSGVIEALASSDRDVISLGGLDMVLCSFNLQEMSMDYACGSRPLLRIRDGKSELFKGEKYPVGMILDKERYFTTHVLKLKAGDKYYMYSDGYTDQFGGPNYDKFMPGKFVGLLEGFDNMTMEEQKEGLEIIMDEWIGDRNQIDDMLVIGVGV